MSLLEICDQQSQSCDFCLVDAVKPYNWIGAACLGNSLCVGGACRLNTPLVLGSKSFVSTRMNT